MTKIPEVGDLFYLDFTRSHDRIVGVKPEKNGIYEMRLQAFSGTATWFWSSLYNPKFDSRRLTKSKKNNIKAFYEAVTRVG
jgi:hypothetical protein